jgi:thioredoxin reductase (NADPH)
MELNLFSFNSDSEVDLSQIFDVVIIGGGPAGLTSGLYAGRYRLNTLLIEKELLCGGQMLTTEWVENYPGFDEPILGNDLSKKMESQVIKSGVQILRTVVEAVQLSGDIKEISTPKGIVRTKAVVICTGTQPKLLNVPGEIEFRGKGVSYCAACDGPFYPDKTIAVIGGGNTAVQESLFLSKYAKKIYLIHRRDSFRADKIMQEKLYENQKIVLVLNTVLREINFKDKEDKFIQIVKAGTLEKLKVDAVFIFVGIVPNNEIFKDYLKLDDNGYIITDESMQTNLKGVYAVGDIRSKELRQIATAIGDGAIAAHSIEKYLSEGKD